MKKSKQAGTDFYLALLDWRNTRQRGLAVHPCKDFVAEGQEHFFQQQQVF